MSHRATGLPAKLMQFFRENPDEELRYTDIVAKFGTSMKNAHYAVHALVATGEIESVHVIRCTPKGPTP